MSFVPTIKLLPFPRHQAPRASSKSPIPALAVFRRALLHAALVLTPALIGGWFLFVGLASYSSLPGHSIALPQTSASSPFLDDFVVFHTAGRHVIDDAGTIYDPDAISVLEADATGQDTGRVLVLPFFNPPSALLPLALLGLLPLATAAALWLAAGAIVAFACVRRLTREVALTDRTAMLVLLGVATSLPFYQTLLHGQMTFLLLAGFTLYVCGLLRQRRPALIFGGLLILGLKPLFLAMPLLYLMLRREYRLVATFAATEGVIVLAAALLFGLSLPLNYASLSLHALGWDEANGISTYGMFGWTALWRGILGPDAHSLQSLLALTCSLASVGAFIWAFRRDDRAVHALAAVVLVSLLVSAHSYAQDLLLLTIPLLLIAVMKPGRPTWGLLAMGTWLAAYVHFDVLGVTGVGPANVALVLLAGFVFRESSASEAPAERPRPREIQPGFPATDTYAVGGDAACSTGS